MDQKYSKIPEWYTDGYDRIVMTGVRTRKELMTRWQRYHFQESLNLYIPEPVWDSLWACLNAYPEDWDAPTIVLDELSGYVEVWHPNPGDPYVNTASIKIKPNGDNAKTIVEYIDGLTLFSVDLSEDDMTYHQLFDRYRIWLDERILYEFPHMEIDFREFMLGEYDKSVDVHKHVNIASSILTWWPECIPYPVDFVGIEDDVTNGVVLDIITENGYVWASIDTIVKNDETFAILVVMELATPSVVKMSKVYPITDKASVMELLADMKKAMSVSDV